MGARMGVRTVAVSAVLGLALVGCSGDGEDESTPEREWPADLAGACDEIGPLLQPEFDQENGDIDYETLTSELEAYAENGDQATADALAPLAEASEAMIAVAAADAEYAQAQEDLLSDPDSIPSEFLELEPGEEATIELPGGDPAVAEQAAAADEAFQAAREDLSAQCDAEGTPLIDPDEVEAENQEIEDSLRESGAPGEADITDPAEETTAP
ncbi:hypothetical protein RDV89_11150 [Nocardioides zeae]|uniref:Small secreted protein n=1 Tax=Nocardioides imazamoxiresistens TaxID=3231893 RepID=A0ABU3PWQ8_9ACTN|nr:hypothetical protein [Nocardioides zeae]MDT9593626.1 hypothetical protein [Nocardioides zeae]